MARSMGHGGLAVAVPRGRRRGAASPGAVGMSPAAAWPAVGAAELLGLHRLVGNQAVAALVSAAPSPRPSAPPRLQRMAYETVSDPVRRIVPQSNATLTAILQAATLWEQQATDTTEQADRERFSSTTVNRYLQRNFDDIMDPSTRAGTLTELLNSLPSLLQAYEPPSPLELVEMQLFTFDQFRADRLGQVATRLAALTLKEQTGLLRRIADEVGLSALSYLGSFDKVQADDLARAALFERLILRVNFLELAPTERERHLSLAFGPSDQRAKKLPQLVVTHPTLALVVGPAAFVSQQSTKKAPDFDALGKAVPGMAKLLPVLAQVPAQHVESAIQQFGYFVLRLGDPGKEIVAALAPIVDAIVTHPSAAARPHLFDALAAVLAKPSLERVKGLAAIHEDARLMGVLLADLYPAYDQDENVGECIFKHVKKFKRTGKGTILDALLTLKRARLGTLTRATVIERFFAATAQLDSFAEQVDNFRFFTVYLNLGNLSGIAELDTYGDFKNLVQKQFTTALEIEPKQLKPESLENLGAQLRSVDDLLAYAGTLSGLDDPERSTALANLRRIVLALMEDPSGEAFEALRYGEGTDKDSEKWAHLRKVLGIEGVRGEWKRGSETVTFESKGKPFEIRDTDAPADLLMLGTDFGSCQSTTGSPVYNKCLLSYLMDGKNRAIVVKAKNDSVEFRSRPMVARALFRILVDSNGEVVLYLEKPYLRTDQIDTDEVKRQLVAMVMARAKAIGAFLKLQVAASTEYESILEQNPEAMGTAFGATSGPAEFDYVDSGSGVTPVGALAVEKSMAVVLGKFEPVKK